MAKLTAAARRDEYAQNLLRALPQLAHFSAEELSEMMTTIRKPGRPPGAGRISPEEDDRFLYVMAFQQRTRGIPPAQTLRELLGPSTHGDYPRILKRYEDHPETYRDVGLVLRWNEENERLSVTPTTAADLPNLPEPILDIEELLKQKP
jgi:hypothetical protein